MAHTLSYPGRTPDSRPRTLELLTWEETERLVPSLLRVSQAAYLLHLVELQQLATPESVSQYYDPNNPLVVDRYRERTREIHELGSRIVVERKEPGSDELLGFSKWGPAPAMTRDYKGGYFFDGWYVNNIAVDPEAANQGVGSRLMHGSIQLNQCDPEAQAVLDAIVGNDAVANRWYREMGFVPRPDVPTDVFGLEGGHIPEMYYVAPRIGGLVTYLETRHPELQDAQPDFT